MDALGFIGMKRSGHHAVINWFLRNYEGRSEFFNNVGVLPDPRHEWPGHLVQNWQPGEALENKRPDLVVYNIEDRTLEESEFISGLFFERIGIAPKRWKLVVVVRDAYNCFASRLERREGKALPPQAGEHDISTSIESESIIFPSSQ